MRIFSLLSLLLLSSSAFAEPRHAVAASTPSYSSGGATEIAVGVSDTSHVTNAESATAFFSMGRDWLQTYLGVYQTKGNFDFAVGGAYKFTLAGTRATGFHVGPGFTVGTVNDDFAWAIFGAAGGHFTFAEHLLLSVDAGPMVTHTKNNTNFRLRPIGQLLGLTVAYVF